MSGILLARLKPKKPRKSVRYPPDQTDFSTLVSKSVLSSWLEDPPSCVSLRAYPLSGNQRLPGSDASLM